MAIFIIITLVYMYPLVIVDYCLFLLSMQLRNLLPAMPAKRISLLRHVSRLQWATPIIDHAYSKKACPRNKVLTRGLLCRFWPYLLLNCCSSDSANSVLLPICNGEAGRNCRDGEFINF